MPDMYWAERRDEDGNLELVHTIKKKEQLIPKTEIVNTENTSYKLI